MKIPRNQQPNNFSATVKDRFSQYTRTGQACDRCKVRKIRCDPNPMGCAHCVQQNIPCYVTDRVTGRTVERAYLTNLEAEVRQTQDYVKDLEKILHQNHIHVIPGHLSPNTPPPVPVDMAGNLIMDPNSNPWSKVGGTWVISLPPTANFNSVLFRDVQLSRPEVTHPAMGGNGVPPIAPNAHNGVPPNVHNGVPPNVHNGVPPNAHDGVPLNAHNGVPHNAHNGVPQNAHNAHNAHMMPDPSAQTNPMMFAPYMSQEDMLSRSFNAWQGWPTASDFDSTRTGQ